MITKDQSLPFASRLFGALRDPFPPDDVSTIVRSYNCVRTRTGERMPHWKAVIDAGGNATTGLTAQWDSYKSNRIVGSESWYWTDNTGPFRSELDGDAALCDVDIARSAKNPQLSTTFADNSARAKFYKKLRKEAVAMSGPTFLGELGETVRMIKRPASALWSKNLGYLDALGKAKRASPKAWTKRISGLWLEHSFGWTPLISDISDAAAAFETLVTGKRRKIISGSFQDYADYSNTLGSLDNTNGSPRSVHNLVNMKFDKVAWLTEECTVRYKGAIKPRVGAPAVDPLVLYGFTPSEIVPTAWELLPWSFLIDYFTNIGDILTALVTSTADVAWTVKTVIQKTEYKGRLTYNPSKSTPAFTKNYQGSCSSPAEYVITSKRVTRSPGSSVPLPSFQMNLGLGNGQLFNCAALLGQARALHPQQVRPRRYR